LGALLSPFSMAWVFCFVSPALRAPPLPTQNTQAMPHADSLGAQSEFATTVGIPKLPQDSSGYAFCAGKGGARAAGGGHGAKRIARRIWSAQKHPTPSFADKKKARKKRAFYRGEEAA